MGSDFLSTVFNIRNYISIHTPLAGSDIAALRNADFQVISIHTPLAGSDGYGSSQSSPERNFNPHSPCGERPGQTIGRSGRPGISIHTPLAGSDVDMLDINDIHVISIHTPLAGSDRKTLKTSANSWNFNPHSPCGERRAPLTYASCICQFQSTLPLRGATPPAQADGPRSNHFNPHSPCGERLEDAWNVYLGALISIHTPLAGSDRRNETFLTK